MKARLSSILKGGYKAYEPRRWSLYIMRPVSHGVLVWDSTLEDLSTA